MKQVTFFCDDAGCAATAAGEQLIFEGNNTALPDDWLELNIQRAGRIRIAHLCPTCQGRILPVLDDTLKPELAEGKQ